VEDSAVARKRMAREYDRDPEGWSVYVSRDRDRFYDTLVSHDDEMWYLKEYSVNPYRRIGVAERKRESTGDSLNFGLRAFDTDVMRALQSAPQRSEDIRTPYVLEGPAVVAEDMAISEAHEELDARLRAELKRIMDREYSHLSYPYL